MLLFFSEKTRKTIYFLTRVKFLQTIFKVIIFISDKTKIQYLSLFAIPSLHEDTYDLR